MITILHAESSLGWGGQERRTLRELLGLSGDSFSAILACQPESRIGEEARNKNVLVEMIKMRGNFDPLAVARFLWMVHHYSVEIVHTHSSADSWMASTAAKSGEKSWFSRRLSIYSRRTLGHIYSRISGKI